MDIDDWSLIKKEHFAISISSKWKMVALFSGISIYNMEDYVDYPSLPIQYGRYIVRYMSRRMYSVERLDMILRNCSLNNLANFFIGPLEVNLKKDSKKRKSPNCSCGMCKREWERENSKFIWDVSMQEPFAKEIRPHLNLVIKSFNLKKEAFPEVSSMDLSRMIVQRIIEMNYSTEELNEKFSFLDDV